MSPIRRLVFCLLIGFGVIGVFDPVFVWKSNLHMTIPDPLPPTVPLRHIYLVTKGASGAITNIQITYGFYSDLAGGGLDQTFIITSY